MRKFLKKSTALFISLMLSITCFAVVPFSAFADSTGIQITDESQATVTVYNKDYKGTAKMNSFDATSFESAISGAKNIVTRGKSAIIPYYTDNYASGTWTKAAFTDDQYNYQIDGLVTNAGYNLHNSSAHYARWEFDSGVADNRYTRFYFTAGSKNMTSTALSKIELYVSNDISTLFDASNKCLAISNSTYTDRMFTDIAFDPDGDMPTGRYVGILCPENKITNWREIGLETFTFIDPANLTFVSDYQAEVKGKFDSKAVFDGTYNKDNNLLSKSKIDFYQCTDGATWNYISFTRPENLYDGSSTTSDARADGTGGRKYRAIIDFEKDYYEISRIYVSRSGNYTFGAYEIYVANDEYTLFNAENKVYSLTNPNTADGARTDCVTFNGKNKPKGKYVGISTPNSSNYFIFYEFGIEGTELDCFEPDTEKSDFVNINAITKACKKGEPYEFSLITHSGANITSVKYDGTTLTASEGVYTITDTNTNKKLSITTDKDEFSPINGVWRDIDLRNKKDNAELMIKNPDVSIHETALIYDTTIGDKDLDRRELSLLYPVDNVVSLRSYDLKTIYYEGEDFIVTADGKIRLTENTSIPIYGDDPSENLDPRCIKGNPGSYSTDWDAQPKWMKVKWKYDIDVTYTHSTTWGKDALYERGIEDQSENLSYFYNKAKSGEHTNVVFIGSSIMEGYYATSFDLETYLYSDPDQRLGPTDEKVHHTSLSNFQSAGYTLEDLKEWGGDSFAKQIETTLVHAFGDNFTFVNRGVGSTTLPWTLNNKEFLLGPADPNCNPEGCPTPDLVVIYLGGNEATAGYSNYKPQLTELVTYIRTLNPNCNVVFCSSSYANRYDKNGKLECYSGGIGGQEQAAAEVAETMGGMVAVPTWSVFKSLIDDGDNGANYGGTKQVFDYMGDMVNHPNDFGHTLWAKSALQGMGLDNILTCEHTETELRNEKTATSSEDGYTGDTVCINCGKIIERGTVIPKTETVFSVSFTDKTGKIIYSTTVEEGGKLTAEDIAAASSKVREVLGFVRSFDANGKQIWSSDTSVPIFADTLFTAVYEVDPYEYDVSVTYSGGTVENFKKHFNDKIVLFDSPTKSWYNFGKFYSENKLGIKFYIGGDMKLTSSTEVSTTARLSLIGVVVGENADGNTLTTLAHLSNPKEKAIESFGFNYISKTYYNLMSETDRNKDWKTVTGYGKTCVSSAMSGNTRDFYTTLEGISTTSKVTRYAQAYVTFTDGTTVVSDIDFRSFGDDTTEEEGYNQTTAEDTLDEE